MCLWQLTVMLTLPCVSWQNISSWQLTVMQAHAWVSDKTSYHDNWRSCKHLPGSLTKHLIMTIDCHASTCLGLWQNILSWQLTVHATTCLFLWQSNSSWQLTGAQPLACFCDKATHHDNWRSCNHLPVSLPKQLLTIDCHASTCLYLWQNIPSWQLTVMQAVACVSYKVSLDDNLQFK